MKLKPFKVYVAGRAAEIQKHLLALGCKWGYSDVTITRLDCPFIYVDAKNKMTHNGSMMYFNALNALELTAGEVLAIPIEKPEHQFKPFDRVLVRDYDTAMWAISLYSHRGNHMKGFTCSNSYYWTCCIPYEGNEHLVGTNKS